MTVAETRIKICGLTRFSDIEAVNEARPEYIGFVFAESRRRVTPWAAEALRARLSPGIEPVGVFVDEDIRNIIPLVQSGIIRLIQLHGAEDEIYIEKLKAKTDAPIIKAVRMEKGAGRPAGPEAAAGADYLLLDSPGGGTGQAFDWGMIGGVSQPFFLAGGLNPGNVGAARRQVSPFAVDVSSGVETNGWKDREKIKWFIEEARSKLNEKN